MPPRSILGESNRRQRMSYLAYVFHTHSFIVLQHDLYEVTVDMAIGYTLNAAQTHQPAFTVRARTVRTARVTKAPSFLARAHRRMQQDTHLRLVHGDYDKRVIHRTTQGGSLARKQHK